MLLQLNKKQLAGVRACTGLASIILAVLIGWRPLMQVVCAAGIAFLMTGGRPQWIYAAICPLPRDIKAAWRFICMNRELIRFERNQETVPDLFGRQVRRHPDKVAFYMNDQRMTFAQVDLLSNRIAHYFRACGYRPDDTIALLMENRAEYACVWLGLAKIGIITALINTNLRKEPLHHSIRITNSKAIIASAEMISALDSSDCVNGVRVFCYDNVEKGTKLPFEVTNLCDSLAEVQDTEVTRVAGISATSKLVYIYTSGTTGLPKAAVITHLRYMFMVYGCNKLLALRDDDIIYNSLPLYHTAGGMVGVGNVLLLGLSMVLRKKFSASNYWTDCIKYKCTVGQYIGEICRYLLAVPAKPHDTQHTIRMMYGNGLRPQIWPQFVSRFGIAQVGEVYGATEGNSNLVNIDSHVGAVGFVPRFNFGMYPVSLVKCDEQTGEVVRNANGLCEQAAAGVPGILVGRIIPKKASSAFGGYADRAASEKKILRNVYRNGDQYFNSGDILVADILGYYYFKDRTGDTFRWRGENVATSEVEAVISNIVGLSDSAVYGVEIPGVEGKACMAAIVDAERKMDIEEMSIGIRGSLPPYARPLFIRVLSALPMTGTFKLMKRELQMEAYNLDVVKDELYFMHADGVYRPFTREDYDNVINGRARL